MTADTPSSFDLLQGLLRPPAPRPSRLQRLLPCSGTLPELLDGSPGPRPLGLPVWSSLRSLGQVIFINNPLSGAVLLLAFLLQSPWLALLALAGTAAAQLTSRALQLPPVLRLQGIHGFNGTLVGCAVAAFARLETPAAGLLWLVLVLLGAALTTVLLEAWRRCAHRRGDPPPLTLPFCLVTWLVLALAHTLQLPLADGATPAELPLLHPLQALLEGLPRSFGQVFLCSASGSGWLVLAATALASPLAALLGLAGALAAMLTALLLGVPAAAIAQGLWGYDGVLVAIAVGGIFHAPTRRSLAIAIPAAAASSPLLLLQSTALPAVPPLTFAFVLITWTVQWCGRRSLPALLPVSLHALVTPEEHRQRYRVARGLLADFRRNLRRRSGACLLGDQPVPELLQRKSRLLFDRLDRDGDGSLSVAELQRAIRSTPLAEAPGLEHRLEAVLAALDLDGDGRVDPAEFAQLLLRLQRLQEGEERLLLYLMPADADGDQRLDATELQRLLVSVGEPPLAASEQQLVFGPERASLSWRGLVDRILLT